MSSNSELADVVILSPYFSRRTRKIDTITIHCMAGIGVSAEACGRLFQQPGKNASSNYGIGYDGKIGLYVEEDKASWCSSNGANDNRSITIEVANSGGSPDWPVSDASYASLIRLVADICWRNGIERLIWSPNKADRINHTNGCNMTLHRDFANKSCPGNYLVSKHAEIAETVNKILEEKEYENMTRYNKIADMPEWAQSTVRKLADGGIIRGSGTAMDEEGRPADLNLTEDMLRMLVWNDRAGVYDGKADTEDDLR